jgi:hypothetical protein
MSDRIVVKAALNHLRGEQVAAGGVLYVVHPDTMQLHEMSSGGFPLPEPGVRKSDIGEFVGQAAFAIAGTTKLPPPPPPAPGKKAAGASGGSGSHGPDLPGPPDPPDAFDLQASENKATTARQRLLKQGREFMEGVAEKIAIPHDGMADEDLAAAIMMAKGFTEEEALGVHKVDQPQPKFQTKDRTAQLDAMARADVLALAKELGIPNAHKTSKAKLFATIVEAESK